MLKVILRRTLPSSHSTFFFFVQSAKTTKKTVLFSINNLLKVVVDRLWLNFFEYKRQTKRKK